MYKRQELKQIEAVLNEKVRPSLRAHGGELEIDHLADGVLYIKLLGQCAGLSLIHICGLAGAVLAHQAADGAAGHGEGQVL